MNPNPTPSPDKLAEQAETLPAKIHRVTGTSSLMDSTSKEIIPVTHDVIDALCDHHNQLAAVVAERDAMKAKAQGDSDFRQAVEEVLSKEAGDSREDAVEVLVRVLNHRASALTQLRAENEKLLAERENWRMSSVCRDLKAELERARPLLIRAHFNIPEANPLHGEITDYLNHLNPKKTP